MKLKDLVLLGNEFNVLLFDADKKEEGWITTKGTTEKKITEEIKEAVTILAADDELSEASLATLREIDWQDADFEKEEPEDQATIKTVLQGMGIWLDTPAEEEVEEVEEVEEKPVPAKKAPAKKQKSVSKKMDEHIEESEVIEEDTQILTLRDNAKAELAQIKTIEGGIEYLHKVQSIATWMQAEKKDAELQNMVAEQKIRTQRILGELIQEGQESGEIATQKQHGKGIQTTSMPQGKTRKTLDEIGISHKQSSTYKQIADIPEKEFDAFIEEKKEAVDLAVSELTTKGAIQLAKNLKKKSENVPQKAKAKIIKNEDELHTLADMINEKFNKTERNFLKSLIK